MRDLVTLEANEAADSREAIPVQLHPSARKATQDSFRSKSTSKMGKRKDVWFSDSEAQQSPSRVSLLFPPPIR
jgi:hypothetical protein